VDETWARGARLLFLPPYSPDLSPIDQVFAKLKHQLRKAAQCTQEATWRRIGTVLGNVSVDECANYLRNSGYASVYCHPKLVAQRIQTVVIAVPFGHDVRRLGVRYRARYVSMGLGWGVPTHAPVIFLHARATSGSQRLLSV